ncbi:hypothetical protein [Portibacter marinus]|uniref:hypothetical protein n=1 Tax=Portibacter marinus TaxID=2898660 RepID=UPI001F30C9E3|nr:hypothetical protein [Portibacter marinus]
MKNLTILTGMITMVFFSACTSLEKMVERGNYDEAIVKVARKMSGKNKKTKDVKILEQAFAKVTADDLAYAQRLKESQRPSAWDEVFNTYHKIEERQDLIAPFLPLVSKDGYRAKFRFANVAALKDEAADHATVYNYNEAERLLSLAENGDKRAARRAYDKLVALEKYTDSYKDSRTLLEEAQFLGTNRVLVKLHNNTFGFMPREVEREIMSVNIKEMNTFWTKYYTREDIGYDFDYVARLDLDEIAVSPEREVINRYVDKEEIKDGWQYVLDEKGNVKKDSLGNDLKVDKFVTVVAEVVEIHRTKSAVASGRFGLFHAETKELIETRPFNVEAHFSEYASTFNGDRRALCERTRSRLRTRPLAFPSDLAMSMDVAHELKEVMKNEMRRFSI